MLKIQNLINLTVCILDRPRHEKIISSLKKMNVKLKLISDGDISSNIYC